MSDRAELLASTSSHNSYRRCSFRRRRQPLACRAISELGAEPARYSMPSLSSSTTTSLADVYPWCTNSRGDNDGGERRSAVDAVIVADSVESDGRFVLYQHAARILLSSSNHDNKLLWLACGPTPPRLVLRSLKKLGYDHHHSNDNNQRQKLQIRCLASEIGDAVLADEEEEFSPETFVKRLYRQIKEWVVNADEAGADDQDEGDIGSKNSDKDGERRRWIVLDDVSSLACLIGSDRLAYALVMSIKSLLLSQSQRQQRLGLMVRCSNDFDQELCWKNTTSAGGISSGGGRAMRHKNYDWFGAGGGGDDRGNATPTSIPWERSLIELADYVVDVCPLPSGASRDVHGRLIITPAPSTLATCTKKNATSLTTTGQPLVFNYCLTDNDAVAIRIQR